MNASIVDEKIYLLFPLIQMPNQTRNLSLVCKITHKELTLRTYIKTKIPNYPSFVFNYPKISFLISTTIILQWYNLAIWMDIYLPIPMQPPVIMTKLFWFSFKGDFFENGKLDIMCVKVNMTRNARRLYATTSKIYPIDKNDWNCYNISQ